MPRQRIAIVGSGIAGLSAAHYLHPTYDITLFEANEYLGGHTHTVVTEVAGQSYAVDTGFIVFNEHTYPHFIALLDALGVPKQLSNMSFSFRDAAADFEYGGDTLNGLFAQRRRLADPHFYRLLWDIARFNREAQACLQRGIPADQTISDWVSTHRYGRLFQSSYLLPLAAAIWSTPAHDILDMPLSFLFTFYQNHGLFNVVNRPPWYVVAGGSHTYVEKITAPWRESIHCNTPVRAIQRAENQVTVRTDTGSAVFDAVVLACHSDQALALLEKPTADEYDILSQIPYQENIATLHTDPAALPTQRAAWSSWHYQQHGDQTASLTYYMNKLQTLACPEPICVSINHPTIDPAHVIQTMRYAHPRYTEASVKAKSQHHRINGQQHTFYTGAYWGNGFHEDGVRTSYHALAPLLPAHG
jgi:predicted NAD/FAD-binding protein